MPPSPPTPINGVAGDHGADTYGPYRLLQVRGQLIKVAPSRYADFVSLLEQCANIHWVGDRVRVDFGNHRSVDLRYLVEGVDPALHSCSWAPIPGSGTRKTRVRDYRDLEFGPKRPYKKKRRRKVRQAEQSEPQQLTLQERVDKTPQLRTETVYRVSVGDAEFVFDTEAEARVALQVAKRLA